MVHNESLLYFSVIESSWAWRRVTGFQTDPPMYVAEFTQPDIYLGSSVNDMAKHIIIEKMNLK